MAAQKALVSPDGKREWTPQDATEAVNLKARGWTEKADKPARASNSDSK